MGTGQLVVIVVVGVGAAAALCWAIVGTAVRRSRPPDRARRGAGRGVP